MDLRIGSRIIELRKKKGITQEQLAAALGVSAPAVSKWETDSSYPDITLLCPLARALGTDVDALLAFEEDLSDEDLSRYMIEVMELTRAGRTGEAEGELDRLLHAYPSNIPLKFSAIAVLSLFGQNAPDCAQEDRDRWEHLKKELVQAIYDDGNPDYHMPAISMLVSQALAEDDLGKAEELLKETLTQTADFTMLWMQLYVKKGDQEKALETVQRRLYTLIGEVRTCLMCMMGDGLSLDTDRKLEICQVFQKVEDLFGVGGGMGAGVLAEVYLKAGRKETCLAYLEQLADRLTGGMTPPSPLLFSRAMSQATVLARSVGECREDQIPRSLLRCKFDAPLLIAGYLTSHNTSMLPNAPPQTILPPAHMPQLPYNVYCCDSCSRSA